MGMRSGLVSFCCVVLTVALFNYGLFAGQPETVILIEPIDPSVFDRIPFKGFTKSEEALLREALLPKFTGRCTQAFQDAGLQSPWETAWATGITFQYSRDLYVKEAADLRLVYTETRDRYRAEFSTGRAQAGTVPRTLYETKMTTDNRPHVYLHDSAFVGESFWFGTLSLSDVISHEMIHVAGQLPTPGWLGFLRHDLAGFENYEQILEACR